MRTRTMNGESEARPTRSGKRVVVIELLKDHQEVTDGSAAYVWRPVGPDYVADVGGRLEAITVFTTLKNVSANFAMKMQAQYSNDGRTWTDFAADLTGALSSNGNAVSSAYTTLTDFGRHVRFQLGTADSGASEFCNVSVAVALRFYQGA
jgi:hypothetical protein